MAKKRLIKTLALTLCIFVNSPFNSIAGDNTDDSMFIENNIKAGSDSMPATITKKKPEEEFSFEGLTISEEEIAVMKSLDSYDIIRYGADYRKKSYEELRLMDISYEFWLNCSICHDFALNGEGGPQIDDLKAWEDRLKKGVSALYISTIKSKQCRSKIDLRAHNEDTNHLLKISFDYMISQVKSDPNPNKDIEATNIETTTATEVPKASAAR